MRFKKRQENKTPNQFMFTIYLEFSSTSLEEQLRWNAFKKSAILLIDPDMRSIYSLPAQSACVLN